MEFNAKEQLPGLIEWMRQQMRACGGKRLLFTSTGEIYGENPDVENGFTEDSFGHRHAHKSAICKRSCANKYRSKLLFLFSKNKKRCEYKCIRTFW